jgi:hypothetical protein
VLFLCLPVRVCEIVRQVFILWGFAVMYVLLPTGGTEGVVGQGPPVDHVCRIH